MAKISVSLDDDLVAELKRSAGDNVSAFVAQAVRRQLERQQLQALLAELEDELGPPTEDELAEVAAMFDDIEAASRKPKTAGRPRRAMGKGTSVRSSRVTS